MKVDARWTLDHEYPTSSPMSRSGELKNQILTSIKGGNSVANLGKTKIYNTNVDLVNNNVHTKFGLNLSIRSQDI